MVSDQKIRSIKTEISVAWGFTGIILTVWILMLLFYVYTAVSLYNYYVARYYPSYYISSVLTSFIPLILGFFILMIPSMLVFRRLYQMRGAANRGDIGRLKQLNSVGWGVAALIFAGVIPGVLTLMAHGPIEALGATPMIVAPVAGATLDGLDRVGKLKGLLDSGAITQEDFDEQKHLILHSSASSQNLIEEPDKVQAIAPQEKPSPKQLDDIIIDSLAGKKNLAMSEIMNEAHIEYPVVEEADIIPRLREMTDKGVLERSWGDDRRLHYSIK